MTLAQLRRDCERLARRFAFADTVAVRVVATATLRGVRVHVDGTVAELRPRQSLARGKTEEEALLELRRRLIEALELRMRRDAFAAEECR